MCARAAARRLDGMTSTDTAAARRGGTAHHVARVELAAASSRDARSVIRQLTRLARRLPDRVEVVVSIPSVDALTVDLLAGIAVGRRLMTAHGRHLLLRVPGRPATPGAAALLTSMPFVLAP